MSNIDTAKLRALAETATPGPWGQDFDGVHCDHMVYSDTPDDNTTLATTWGTAHGGGENFGQAQRDAAFIAAANPQTMIALLDEVARLDRGMRDAWAAQRDALTKLHSAKLRLEHVTDARDEACDLATEGTDLSKTTRQRIAELRKVGAK